MDLRVNNYSFKGSQTKFVRKLPSLLVAATMGLSINAYSQNNSTQKGSFTRNSDYVTLSITEKKQVKTDEVLNSLNKSKFFLEKDNPIIASILATLGVETLGCINDESHMEAFGECNSELYKFYVRKSADNVYYGLADKLVPGKAPDFKDDPANPNRSYAFVLKNVPGENSGSVKQLTFVELAHQNDKYCNDFMFENWTDYPTDDINEFIEILLSKNTKDKTYTLEEK